jgi:hypothetical protein
LLELGYAKGNVGGTLAAGADRIMKERLQALPVMGRFKTGYKKNTG